MFSGPLRLGLAFSVKGFSEFVNSVQLNSSLSAAAISYLGSTLLVTGVSQIGAFMSAPANAHVDGNLGASGTATVASQISITR